MKIGPPKNDRKYIWTNHVWAKMLFYRLSEGRIKRILRNPERTEKGIASDTIACMQRNDKKRKTFRQTQGKPLRGARGREEIWVMWQKITKNEKAKMKNNKVVIISAWRYPGVSPKGKRIEIPDDVLADLRSFHADEE